MSGDVGFFALVVLAAAIYAVVVVGTLDLIAIALGA